VATPHLRDLDFEYVSDRRIGVLQARLKPSRLAFFRWLQTFSFSIAGFGVGWTARKPSGSQFGKTLDVLTTVERDLRRRGDIGTYDSTAPYVEETVEMLYGLWSFEYPPHSGGKRTAVFWYGWATGLGERDTDVILMGNPRRLQGVPVEAFGGIPVGSSVADPAWQAARDAVHQYVAQLAAYASRDKTPDDVPSPDLEDGSVANHYYNLVTTIRDRILHKAVEQGLSETTPRRRRFLAYRVSYSSPSSIFCGIPVYVATVP
jgi:hypothetical protein